MQFKVFEPGVEVSGASLGAIVDGFRKYPTVAMKYLTKQDPKVNRAAIELLSEHFRTQFRMSDSPLNSQPQA